MHRWDECEIGHAGERGTVEVVVEAVIEACGWGRWWRVRFSDEFSVLYGMLSSESRAHERYEKYEKHCFWRT